MNTLESLSFFFFGRVCLGCGQSSKPLDPYLCPQCKEELLSYGERPIFPNSEDVLCLFPMNSLTRSLVLAMKYKGMQKIAPYLVRHSSVGRNGEGLQILEVWGRGSFFFPVPIHKARRRERGYNQCEQAALEISLKCGGILKTDVLTRKIYRPSQTLLGDKERSLNVAGAFEAKKQPENGKNNSAIIVDDVYTTGATTQSCIRALAKAGWKNVKVCTLLYELPASSIADRAADIRLGWRTEED